ncbi:MAG: HYR domain-containing protein [Acidobacteria bacterium]|nr:HYR domain-containing protein [Acidobacteriota bacterium]
MCVAVSLMTLLSGAFYETSSAFAPDTMMSGEFQSASSTNARPPAMALVKSGVTNYSTNHSTAAARGTNPFLEPDAPLAALLAPALFFASESVSIFAADCSTPKTAFALGQTACTQITDAPVIPGRPLRRFVWVDPDGFARRSTDVTASTQFDSFNIPSSPTSIVDGITLRNRGTWRVVDVDTTNGRARFIATFTVSDPANPSADLSVIKYNTSGKEDLHVGENVAYQIIVRNAGPDAAANVHLTDAVPANMTWVSETQVSGPAFTCTNPPAGGTGTTDCSITSLPRDAEAQFKLIYLLDGNTPDGTIITNTADITASASTPDPKPIDNSSSAGGKGITAPLCVIDVPADISVNNEAGQSGAQVTYTAPTVHNCGSVTCNPVSGSFFSIGTTVVQCGDGVNDPAGFNVTVNDIEPPSVSCPQDISVPESSSGSGHATVNFTLPTATDNDPRPGTVTSSPASGSQFNVGTTPVTVTATDASGNTATCTFNVIVTSSTCMLTCPQSITITEDPAGSGTAVVTFADPTTSGSCGTVTYDHPSGSTFNLGTTPVTATATGGGSCSFNVTVNTAADTEPPVISCPDSITQDAPANSCAVTLDPGTATATDDRPGVTVSGSRSDGLNLTTNPYPVGTTTITWTATDAAGNTAQCQQTVTIRDVTPPTAQAPAPETISANDSCDAQVPDFKSSVGASDNCTEAESLTITQSPAAGTSIVLGSTTPVTITVTDASNNSTSVSTTVTVADNTPPTITAPPDATYSCASQVPAADPSQATAADNCGTPTVSVSQTSIGAGSTSSPLVITRTYTASDTHNSASATQTITVIDNVAPVISCPSNITIALPLNSTATAMPVSYSPATATDNCDGAVSITYSSASGATYPLGTTTVSVTATDAVGNTASCRQLVIVFGDGSVRSANFKFK